MNGDSDLSTVDLEQGHCGANELQAAMDRELDRVLKNIECTLRNMIQDHSYLNFSSESTNEYFAVVHVRYHAAVDVQVVANVQRQYSRQFAQRHLQRPYFVNFLRYNVLVPLKQEPKKIFCTSFYFKFIDQPTTPPSPLETPPPVASDQ